MFWNGGASTGGGVAITAVDGRRLADAHRHGDDGAFPELVRLHRSGLLARARYRLGDDQAAEDAVQECFLRAYRALPAFGVGGEWHLSAWLYRILENVCVDEANRRRRSSAIVERLAAQPEELAPAPEAVADLGDPQVTIAIEGLPATYRDALIQREVEGLDYADIAAAAGITEDNARARVSRARSALRRLITPVLTAVAWLAGTTRRGERVLLEGTTHAAATSSATAAVAPVSVHIPTATHMITQVTAVVPESSLVSAVKVATAAVIAVALPVGGVTAVSRPDPAPSSAPAAMRVIQSPQAPEAARDEAAPDTSDSAPAEESTEAGKAGADGAALLDLTAAIDDEVAAEDADAAGSDATADGAGERSAAEDDSTTSDDSTTTDSDEAAAGPTGDTEEQTPEPSQPASAVVLDTRTVYRNTLDDGRFELDGPASFTTASGEFAGRLTITCAAPSEGDKDNDDYRLAGSLVTTGDESGRIRLSGTMQGWYVGDDGVTTYVYSGRYSVADDAGYALTPKGSFTVSFRESGRSELLVRLVPNSGEDTTS